MTVWTISTDHGTFAENAVARLAEIVDVPIISLEVTQALAQHMGVSLMDADAMEHQLSSRLQEIAMTMAAGVALMGEAVMELRRPMTLRSVTEQVIRAAAQQPCIVMGRAGFAILADHEDAVHVRIWAPRQWRVEQLQERRRLSREAAMREVRREDSSRARDVNRLYGCRLSDADRFHLRIDARRFGSESIAAMLAAAGR